MPRHGVLAGGQGYSPHQTRQSRHKSRFPALRGGITRRRMHRSGGVFQKNTDELHIFFVIHIVDFQQDEAKTPAPPKNILSRCRVK